MGSYKDNLNYIGRAVKNKWEVFFYLLLFGFSTWIMFQTFSYDYDKDTILISGAIWSDYAANLPLIRSFSMGSNWPPEYPIYGGAPIQYHYLFYLFAGFLEKAGLPIHWALNIPSIVGMFLLLAMIYTLGKRLFNDARIGVLSVGFFLFNGSMSFLRHLSKHSSSPTMLKDILESTSFTAMGPWDDGKVLGVWHLNVFVNQRHLGLALGLLLGFILICRLLENRPARSHLRWALLCGIIIGLFPVLHKAVLLIFAIVMIVYFIVFPYLRVFLFATGATSLFVMFILWLLSFGVTGGPSNAVGWYPGFMIHSTLSFINAVEFLWYQFGLHNILIPLGFILAPRKVKLFMLPVFIVFLVAVLFKFSDEILVGHKFINYSLMMGQMLSALVIVKIYDYVSHLPNIKYSRSRASVYILPIVFFSTFSGVLDMIPIVNMKKVRMPDVKIRPISKWFYENTPKDAIVLTSDLLYAAPSIAGRKTFLGWPYFITGAGYDHVSRFEVERQIYKGEDMDTVCQLLIKHNLTYMDVEDTSADPNKVPVNVEYFRENFKPDYVSKNGKYAIYSRKNLCGL